MKFLKTLRARFALWTAGLLLTALILFGLFVYAYMLRSLRATVDHSLDSAATQMIAEGMRSGLIVLDDLVSDPQYLQLNEEGLSIRLLDAAGTTLQTYGPYQTWPDLPADSSALLQRTQLDTLVDPKSQTPIRVYTTTFVRRENVRSLQVALSMSDVQKTMNLLLAALLVGVPIIVILAGTGGYFLAAQALSPIDTVTRTALQISDKDLSARLHLPATDDEVGRLVATFDSMLERLDAGFRRERQFTADASHELRTPLAAMQTIIGSTLTRKRAPDDYEQALIDLNKEVEQMRSLTEGLLILARNGATYQSTRLEQVDLALLLKDVMDSLRPLAEDKGLQIVDKVPSRGLSLEGSRDGLIRLFVNLVDNAIKYSKEGTITISTQMTTPQMSSGQPNGNQNVEPKLGDEPLLQVTVSDTGIGIPAQHLPYIFDRFYRVDSSRSSEGIGLGLAIASDIVRLHGGTITVQSEVGKGTTFVVTLPLQKK